ncbi:MAG: radical SAM protein, partial [Bacteroidota bacterium]
MRLSKHTIISRITDSEEYFIINPLVQQADILDKEEAEKILSGDYSLPALQDKKYVMSEQEEQQIFTQKYLDFIDARDSDEIQIFFAPWYACNFACSYCYQHEYTNPNEQVKPEIIDAFFEYIETTFAGRRKYITIFGGEPLMKGEKHAQVIESIITQAAEKNIDIAVVTNGYHINEYIDVLAQGHIREVQVTLDGTENVHNSRRMIHGGGGSFTEIVSGIDTLLSRKVPVNLRVVVDKDNISNLPELAEFAREKGWTNSPLFKTQLGRNYELHSCQTNNQKLFSRIDMYREIYSLIQHHPGFLDFHKPAFSISKFLWE